MNKLLFGIALGALLLALLIGASSDGSDLAQERTQQTEIAERNRTERTAIVEDARTERTYINAQQLMWLATERESTLRLVIVLLLVIVASAAGVGGAVLVLRRPPADDHHYLLSVRSQLPPGWTVRRDPAVGWIATNGNEYMLAQDVRAYLQ
jgi:hypothetical protein